MLTAVYPGVEFAERRSLPPEAASAGGVTIRDHRMKIAIRECETLSFFDSKGSKSALSYTFPGVRNAVECVVKGTVVGVRYFPPNRQNWNLMAREKNGVTRNRISFRRSPEGCSLEPYSNGLPHGTARQWSMRKLISTYTCVDETWHGRRPLVV
jgi:hypothetical protein